MSVDSSANDSVSAAGVGHLGDPLGEQRAFFHGQAVVECRGMAVVTLSGPDRLTWLDALSSQKVSALPPHQTAENMILSPQGRVEHRFLMTDDGQTSWLLVEPEASEALVAWLEKMRFRADVAIEQVSPLWRVWAVWTDTLVGVLPPDTTAVVWRDPWPGVATGGFAYSGPDHPGSGFALVFVALPPEINPWSEVRQAGQWVLDAADIRAGRPRLATEVDDKALPHELDWLRTAVHLDKGCYRGQETVAKVHNLGRPPRRLVLLHLDGSESVLPKRGDDVVHNDSVVGFITRAVIHHEWGPIALALIKRSVEPQDTVTVTCDGVAVAATQEVLVLPDAGRTNAPQFPRR